MPLIVLMQTLEYRNLLPFFVFCFSTVFQQYKTKSLHCTVMQVAFEKEAKLKAVRPPRQKFWPKILTPSFLYSNLYLHFLRPFCENIFKFVCIVSEQLGNKSHNMKYCSSLQPEVVYNFSEIKSTFQVPFLKLRGDC